MGEVLTALDMLKPSGSMIRNARFEPIFATSAFLAEGCKRVTVRLFFDRVFCHFLAEWRVCLK